MGFEAGIAIVLVAVLLDRLFRQSRDDLRCHAMSGDSASAVSFRDVDIVFGPTPKRALATARCQGRMAGTRSWPRPATCSASPGASLSVEHRARSAS